MMIRVTILLFLILSFESNARDEEWLYQYLYGFYACDGQIKEAMIEQNKVCEKEIIKYRTECPLPIKEEDKGNIDSFKNCIYQAILREKPNKAIKE